MGLTMSQLLSIDFLCFTIFLLGGFLHQHGNDVKTKTKLQKDDQKVMQSVVKRKKSETWARKSETLVPAWALHSQNLQLIRIMIWIRCEIVKESRLVKFS